MPLWNRVVEQPLEQLPSATARVLIIGEAGVGKSSLLMRFSRDRYYDNASATVGFEFATRSIKAESWASQRDIKLQVFDVAGQERFRTVSRSYYRDFAGALLVFDLCNRRSFESLGFWLDELAKYGCRDGKQLNTELGPPVILLGNKSDDKENCLISDAEIQDFCTRRDIPVFLAVSAKSGENVYHAFGALAKQIADRILACERAQLSLETLQGLRVAESIPARTGLNLPRQTHSWC
jgi:small GTP-binding protein